MKRVRAFRRLVTLQEIAASAKVDKSTVSLALCNHPRIPATTRARIRRIARELGYSRDPFLDYFSHLRRAARPVQLNKVVAFVCDLSSKTVFNASRRHKGIFAGASATAEKQGSRIELFLIGENNNFSFRRLDEVFAARNITSVILGALGAETHEVPLDWTRLCGIGIESVHTLPFLDNIVFDYRSAVRQKMAELRARSLRRAGIVVSSSLAAPLVDLLRAGYLLETQVTGQNPAPFLLLDEANTTGTSRLIQQWSEKHSLQAIVAADSILYEAVVALSFPWSKPPFLTSLDTPTAVRGGAGPEENYARLGSHAVELLTLRQQTFVSGLPLYCSTIFLPLRGSTATRF